MKAFVNVLSGEIVIAEDRYSGQGWRQLSTSELVKLLDECDDAPSKTAVPKYGVSDIEIGDYVFVPRNTMGDSRTAGTVPDRSDFINANEQHQTDVGNAMRSFANILMSRSDYHDWTKVNDADLREMFYKELCAAVRGEENFVDGTWYKLHCQLERHHLDQNCPDDVTLVDVIEMICDVVCARAARNPGSKLDVRVDQWILKKAFDNTVAMMDQLVIPIGDKK